jgi:hypothetical protein
MMPINGKPAMVPNVPGAKGIRPNPNPVAIKSIAFSPISRLLFSIY